MQESLIETVINHQMESAYEALDSCYSSEFSGFGKFFFNEKKAKRKLEKSKSQIALFEKVLLQEEISPIRRRNVQLKLETAKKNFEHLKKKIRNEEDCMGSGVRGMEEQIDSPQEAEGDDKSDK